MLSSPLSPQLLLQRLQQGLSSPPVELAYLCHERWPLPRSAGMLRRPLQIMVFDSSFNPPTKAHLALANHPRPRSQRAAGDGKDYDAKLLLLSVRNADKTLKPGDASYIQRLEMMSLLARDVTQRNQDAVSETGGESVEPANVAVAIIDEPTFVGKSSILRAYLQQRCTDLSLHVQPPSTEDSSTPETRLTFLLGFDTLERLFAPRYYGGEAQMFSSLARFFAPPPSGDGSKIVCAHRNTSYEGATEAEKKTLAVARDYIEAGHISFIDIGKEESTFSSTAVRTAIEQARSAEEVKALGLWQPFVPKCIADFIIKEALYIRSS
ncbi:hypothetical protein AX16_002631 [Volvariella volvacea WC 439]|nr:hypothetical protein AX16_002631 [Volvariella volvacea WC 439]